MEEIWKNVPGFNDYQASNLGRVKSFKNNKEKIIGSMNKKKTGYNIYTVCLNGLTLNIGRVILMSFDRLPNENEECDHIDRNSTNNHINNLRWVTRNQNLLNRRNYGNSNFKGVSKCTTSYKLKNGTIKKYIVIKSQITINNKNIYLGNYKTELEAFEAYKKAYLKYYGYEWVD
jgi:hypothetical protein